MTSAGESTQDAKLDELLACPFCGGEAGYNTTRYSESCETARLNGQTLFHGVNCVACGCRTTDIVGHLTKARAAAAWNRRAELRAPTHKGCSCCSLLNTVRETLAEVPGDSLVEQVAYVMGRAPKAAPEPRAILCDACDAGACEQCERSTERGIVCDCICNIDHAEANVEPATWEEWEQARDAFATALIDRGCYCICTHFDCKWCEALKFALANVDALYRRALSAREVES